MNQKCDIDLILTDKECETFYKDSVDLEIPAIIQFGNKLCKVMNTVLYSGLTQLALSIVAPQYKEVPEELQRGLFTLSGWVPGTLVGVKSLTIALAGHRPSNGMSLDTVVNVYSEAVEKTIGFLCKLNSISKNNPNVMCPSVLLYGPPGTGKTSIVSRLSGTSFENYSSSNIKELMDDEVYTYSSVIINEVDKITDEKDLVRLLEVLDRNVKLRDQP